MPGLSLIHILVDRENEIRAFQPQEYWLLDALLDCGAGTFSARFYGTADNLSLIHISSSIIRTRPAMSRP